MNRTLLADILRRMPNLRELFIWDPGQLTSHDLLCLLRSTKLEPLSLRLKSDQDLEGILQEASRFRELRSLGVYCTRLTAEVVRELSKATALRELYIAAVYDSPAEMQQLRDALPGCDVIKGQTY